MSKDDLVRVRHMLDAAREAQSFLGGRSREALKQDRLLTLSLVRLVEVIGEAASQTSKDFQRGHPEIPWAVIVAMRNRLIHAYFDVDTDRVWDTVVEDLPPLVRALEHILPS
jgi:uncharacterized protein with HEPN domain